MKMDLNESTKRNRKRAVSLFEDFVRLCIDDTEHTEVSTQCRSLVKKLVDREENLAESVFMNYCRLENENGGMVDHEDDLVIVIDAWTRCLYSKIGFDGMERDVYLPSTIQTFRQNLQAWSKQLVGRKGSVIIADVFKASTTTMLKKQRRADITVTHTSGKNEKRGFREEEIVDVCSYLLEKREYQLLFITNLFRHICCRTSSLMSISLRNCGLFDFNSNQCCMKVRTEYTKGRGRMLSNDISVFADRTGLETCAIYSLAMCLTMMEPNVDLTPETNLVKALFGNITEKELQRRFKEKFAEVHGIEVADDVGFHSFRKYGATMLKSALMTDKDSETIINLRGGWAQEHSNEKGVQSIVNSSDVKSYYIAYNDVMDARAGKILARGYSTMPHFNPFFHFTLTHVDDLRQELLNIFPRNVKRLVPHDNLLKFAVFIMIGHAKGINKLTIKDPTFTSVVQVLRSMSFDVPADFSQYTYESALRHGMISEYRLMNGTLYRYNFTPQMECVCGPIIKTTKKEYYMVSDDDEEENQHEDTEIPLEDIAYALKLVKPRKNDMDENSGDDLAKQKLRLMYVQVMSLWNNGKGQIPPLVDWKANGTLDRVKSENTALFQRYKTISRQVENYNNLGIDGIIDALQAKGKPITIDNAKVKL